jgi:hypothetical protein
MNSPHQQVLTTYAVAIKYGQGRVHVADPIRHHARTEAIKCPECETIFLKSQGFPMRQLLEELATQHKNGERHPDLIASAPAWTSVAVCDCGR